MDERATSLILILSAIASIIGFILMSIGISADIGAKLALGGSAISQMAAIFYLWPSSTITQKKIWNFMIGSVALTALGTFLYQHSTLIGTSLLFIGNIGVIGLYFVHFAQKRKRKKLDILKLIWVVFTYLLIMLNSLFESLPTDLEFMTTPVLWYAAWIFYKQQDNFKTDRQKAGW